MSTTYYQLFNGKRRLITLILIVITLIMFFFPFFEVVYNGQSVAKVTGLEMLFGKRGHTLLKEMGLDMGISRRQLGDMAVNFGYIVLPFVATIIPVAAMLLGISFLRSAKRASAIVCAILMLLSTVFFEGSMRGYDGKVIDTLRVAKRYVQESADKGKQFVANQTPVLEAAISPEQKNEMLSQTLGEAGMNPDDKAMLIDQINKLTSMKDIPEEEIKPMYDAMMQTINDLGISEELRAKLDEQMKIVPMTAEDKEKLSKEIARMQKQAELMSSYYTFLSGKVYGWEYISTETQVQNQAMQKQAMEQELEHGVFLHYEPAKLFGIQTTNIILGLMALAFLSACIAAIGKYRMVQ